MLVTAGLIAGGVSGCGDSNPVVARVAGTAISTALLHHWEPIESATRRERHAAPARPASGALTFLILARWIADEARELGVSVSDRQATQQLEVLSFDERERLVYGKLPRDTRLSRYLISPVLKPSDRLWLMRTSMLAEQLEQRRLSTALGEVTDAQIADFYKHHQRCFWRPERRDLEVLGNKQVSVVEKAKREIEAGKNFLSVADVSPPIRRLLVVSSIR